MLRRGAARRPEARHGPFHDARPPRKPVAAASARPSRLPRRLRSRARGHAGRRGADPRPQADRDRQHAAARARAGRPEAPLYRSARAAGVPARLVEWRIKALATRLPIGDVGASDTFDIVADQRRAASGGGRGRPAPVRRSGPGQQPSGPGPLG
ncbi:hypothetical protein AB5I41_21385 [Sphingomonas sp. MMS24-JH45]